MKPARNGNVLVVYALTQWPLRRALRDHLYSFRRHSAGRVFYVNAAVTPLSKHLLDLPWDLIVYHTAFLSSRWDPTVFANNVERVRPLKGLAPTVALPQDEYYRADDLSDFIQEFEIDVVLSVAPESELGRIYPAIDRDRTQFGQVLTGYLSDRTLKKVGRTVRRQSNRPIDIGYRAWTSAPWLGRHGMLKRNLAPAFTEAGARHGLVTDCSTRPEDTLYGDAWFEFLAACRYTVGVEGGASIADRDGSVRECTETYLAAHPNAQFDEVERECFPGRDGELEYFAISPRHLEACATRTGQILVSGRYGGILVPGRHYIELRSDLSNLDQVLTASTDEGARQAIDRKSVV